jgi:hypothetical protein
VAFAVSLFGALFLALTGKPDQWITVGWHAPSSWSWFCNSFAAGTHQILKGPSGEKHPADVTLDSRIGLRAPIAPLPP